MLLVASMDFTRVKFVLGDNYDQLMSTGDAVIFITQRHEAVRLEMKMIIESRIQSSIFVFIVCIHMFSEAIKIYGISTLRNCRHKPPLQHCRKNSSLSSFR